jgi:hypothetical protein
MGKVVHLPTKTIPPKSETHDHAGQRYTITYDPGSRGYVWSVGYVRIYKFFGESSTYEKAATAARKAIHRMNIDTDKWEEDRE